GRTAGVFRFDGQLVHLAAVHNFEPEAREVLERAYPMPPNRESLSARAILDRVTVHVPDLEGDPDASSSRRLGRATGYRSVLAVPMLREGIPIGVISVGRAHVGPFSERQIELVKTFADQAVIAFENVRLFTELQTSNRDLTTALDTQTATSDILRVISRTQTNVEPVFDTIVRNAARLCQATSSWIWMLDGDRLRLSSPYNIPVDFPLEIRVSDGPQVTRVIRDGIIFHVADSESDTRITPIARSLTRALGTRAFLMVPLKRDQEAIGALTVLRATVGTFSDAQIEVLKTFADQAVIAVE